MTERFPDSEPSELDTYLVGGRTLREWQAWLCTDERGEYDGDLSVPCSQWGFTGMDCTWAALALECVVVAANGEPDDAEASMNHSMSLVVNNNDDVARLLRENWHAVPDEIKERIDLEDKV